jgi:hypothetical protein
LPKADKARRFNYMPSLLRGGSTRQKISLAPLAAHFDALQQGEGNEPKADQRGRMLDAIPAVGEGRGDQFDTKNSGRRV